MPEGVSALVSSRFAGPVARGVGRRGARLVALAAIDLPPCATCARFRGTLDGSNYVVLPSGNPMRIFSPLGRSGSSPPARGISRSSPMPLSFSATLAT